MTTVNLEVGKKYLINAYFKKSVVEVEMFAHADGRQLSREVLWRNANFEIFIDNEDEISYLKAAEGKDGDLLELDDFSNYELEDAWDGVSEEFVFFGGHFTERQQEELEEEYEAQLGSENWMDRYEFLGDKGFQPMGCYYIIHNGIEIQEVGEE